MMNTSFVKISFHFVSDVLQQDSMETLWAVPVDEEQGHYRIDGIPFYMHGIAYGDVVAAVFDSGEQMLVFQQVVQAAGNSTIQVMMIDQGREEALIRGIFRDMGCRAEGSNTGYFVLAIPEDIDYIPIKLKLEQLTANGVLDYAESCLANNHQYS